MYINLYILKIYDLSGAFFEKREFFYYLEKLQLLSN